MVFCIQVHRSGKKPSVIYKRLYWEGTWKKSASKWKNRCLQGKVHKVNTTFCSKVVKSEFPVIRPSKFMAQTEK